MSEKANIPGFQWLAGRRYPSALCACGKLIGTNNFRRHTRGCEAYMKQLRNT